MGLRNRYLRPETWTKIPRGFQEPLVGRLWRQRDFSNIEKLEKTATIRKFFGHGTAMENARAKARQSDPGENCFGRQKNNLETLNRLFD